MVDRRLLFNVDWVLLGSVLLLCSIGVAMIHSATYTGKNARLYISQMEYVGVGLGVLAVALAADYRRLVDRSLLLYLALIGLLVAVVTVGPRVAGTRRWFVIRHTHLQVQPSEFAKIVAALLVAKIF